MVRRYFNKIRRSFRLKEVDVFPLRKTLRGYSSTIAASDLRAGFNVALLAFPQGIAYAAIAGLPIQYGIFGSAVAAILGPLVSGSRFVVLGPTNATAVLVFASFLSLGITDMALKVAMLPLLVCMTGLFLILGSFLKVANLIQYISRSVITGYITAAAIFIIVNQVQKVLGFEFVLPSGATFFTVVQLSLLNIINSHWPTVLISALTAGVYLGLKKWRASLPGVAISLLVMALLTAAFNHLLNHWDLSAPVKTLTSVDPSYWRIQFPSVSLEWISLLAGSSLVLAFLSILEGASIGKSLAARAGERLDTNKEMLGMGVANVGCALLQGVPASGSLTRSQLNFESGAKTGLASIFSGVLVAVGAFLIGPYTHFIPAGALGVLVIAIGMSLINRQVLRVVWNATGSDRLVFIVTFSAALLIRLDFAIILGVGVSVLLFLRKAAQPELVEYTQDMHGQFRPMEKSDVERVPEISIVHVEGDLFFGAAELFRDQMRQACEKPHLKIVILKLRNAHHLDATSVLALEELIRYMRGSGRHLLISEAKKDAIRIFRNSGLIETLGRENLFPDHVSNNTLATSKALKRAVHLLGSKDAEVTIFVGKSTKSNVEA